MARVGKSNRDREPKRRRREDDYRDQSERFAGCQRSARSCWLIPTRKATRPRASASPRPKTGRPSIKFCWAIAIYRPLSFHTEFEGLDIVPSDKNLVAANLELVDVENRESRLRETLEPVRSQYHYILIDCPPALDLLTLNAMVAADSVLIPIQCEFFALEGISQLMDTIDRVRDSFEQRPRTLKASCSPCTMTA